MSPHPTNRFGANPRLQSPGAVRKRAATPQVLASGQDMEDLATKVKCVTHLIEYYVGKGDKAKCPMCKLERDHDELKADYLIATNELKRITNESEKLRVQVDIGAAMRSALEILDDNDYAWLKLQMYQYKMDKSVVLKPTHGRLEGGKRLRRGEKMPANGFMAMPRNGDPEAHLCTSIGGMAMAEYLDEAITSYGSAQGMGIMLKAWWKALPGATS